MKRSPATVLASVLGALVVFVLLIPSGGVDADPPECYSYFGYVVPCGFGPEQGDGAGFAASGATVGMRNRSIGVDDVYSADQLHAPASQAASSGCWAFVRTGSQNSASASLAALRSVHGTSWSRT